MSAHNYLHFFQLIIYISLSLFNLRDFLGHLPLYLFHLCLLVTGILDKQRNQLLIVLDLQASK